MCEPVNVLVTASGCAPALAFIRGLRAQNQLPVRIIGVDCTPSSFGLLECDGRYTIPRLSDPVFPVAIREICRREQVQVLVPFLDAELVFFAREAPLLAKELGVRVISNSPESVAFARDKKKCLEAAAQAGILVPRSYSRAEAARIQDRLVVKPRSGAGSAGVSVVETPATLERAIAAAGEDILIQEFIDGEEYTVDLVVAPDGRVLAAAPRVRVEVRAGQSYKGRTVDDAELSDLATRCAQLVGITAQGNVQFIRSRVDGRCRLIEVNPKFAAAMGLTIGAGLNLPLVYVKLALRLEVRAAELRRRPDVWMLRAWQERYVDANDLQSSVVPWSTKAP